MLMKNERKKRNPTLVMTVGALAAVGAVSIIRGAKRMVKGAGERVRGLLHSASEDDGV
ncbi:MAG: hypothetical protein IKL79_02070 [Clostridia bacterium]|nr:hypothetical protein [Clostridia bacterium]MBR3680773.1 hypothetical protein [Clostridia bacterium]